MNLQTLSIILIIIVLPITLILSAYTKIQIDTLALQTMYKTQLRNATYDAVVAFQLNTRNNSYSTVSDSMRRDVSAVVQTFIANLASNMGMSGATETTIKPYIPAVVFTLYDGYYIYSPSISYSTDGAENNKKIYEHVLKPYIYYTARYVNDDHGIDVVINYSLDNYVVITGRLGSEGYVTKAGYLVVNKQVVNENEVLERKLPVTTVVYTDKDNKSSINDAETYDVELADMYVTSPLMQTDRLDNGQYIADATLFKNPTQLNINIDMEALKLNPEDIRLRENTGSINLTAEIIRSKPSLMNNTKYYNQNYQGAGGIIEPRYTGEGEHDTGFYVEPSTDAYYIPADSAKQYYEKSMEFTEWVNQHLINLKASDAVKPDGTKYEQFKDEFVFRLNAQNDPEAEESLFTDHKREVIKASIQDNLTQAIASYNQNSEGLGTTANFQMPILSEDEWNQVLTNVCFITFMEGIQVGTKIFNDYAIVTSTKNKEYVPAESLYFLNTEGGDGSYHKINCKHLVDNEHIVGYRNSDFDRRFYEKEIVESINEETKKITFEDKTYYYYMHDELACYYCIVNSSPDNDVDWRTSPNKLKAFYTTMAREKMTFYKTNSYFNTQIVD